MPALRRDPGSSRRLLLALRGSESALAGGGEERKQVTILFADVAGSTMLADHLDPERLREVMQCDFDAMREEIEAEGGTVEKFIGDAVMAAFGVRAQSGEAA